MYLPYHGASSIGCVFTCDRACLQEDGRGSRSFQGSEEKPTWESDRSTIADGHVKMNKIVTVYIRVKYLIRAKYF